MNSLAPQEKNKVLLNWFYLLTVLNLETKAIHFQISPYNQAQSEIDMFIFRKPPKAF